MRNLTMMTDLYQLTMMYGYYKHGMSQNEAVFDLFFRTTRPHSEYSVMAGTQSVIEYINDLHFSQEEISENCLSAVRLMTLHAWEQNHCT